MSAFKKFKASNERIIKTNKNNVFFGIDLSDLKLDSTNKSFQSSKQIISRLNVSTDETKGRGFGETEEKIISSNTIR